ncbi:MULTISPECIES: addiction module antidote protein [unclassified Methylobacterium]|jgi:probable addiction module antidote protein|uniref:addiction module antidote protein n=1 Tax=unclassified Methylobacterium TaxID=2615210 RepID=UPI0013521445|nr:addiction module antidote protein [Methylobacterium sp. 2A]MWV25962.1 putative addiction module antidote protein [Methylobacterium sp. 2A]
MAGSTIQTRPFDVARHLRSPKDAAAYLSAALEENDPAAFRRALGDVARARSMATVAEASGLGRESLYKALSPAGNPSFDTVQRVMSALGLTLTVMPSDDAAAEHG